MSERPAPATLELADVINRHAHRLGEALPNEQRRILTALSACRTAALGGHVETCDHCQHRRIAYNSCRNRHCPKCQASACARWMAARAQELLPVEYFHVVFTLPEVFNRIALANKRAVYRVLFEAMAQTLLEVAANPKRLGAKIGFIAILHTWGQNLSLHPHVHCVVPGGGLSLDGSRWIPCRAGFFLPVKVLSRVFRGKFIDLLRRSQKNAPLRGVSSAELECLFEQAVRTEWVVYSKPPFGGPQQVLKYLARYTHRIAISNRRLVSMDDQNVTFRWKDYAHHNQPKLMTLEAGEFLRRFLMHAVPSGFMRIRHFGLLSNRFRADNLRKCRELLVFTTTPAIALPSPFAMASLAPCPICGKGHLIRGEWIKANPLAPIRLDSS